ncbi:hypothetical protein E2P64_07600 [Candidatus Bathyarchaeota archaeon]|nr:hypothetical protein E2P64_07600 [Candidatus Bathyarchaeota archaeon]
MAKRTIEIEDRLSERVSECCDEIKDLLIEYIKDNDLEEGDSVPCLNDLDDSGSVHEHIDSAVPIYTKEIEDLWYLYSNEFETAYKNAGVGDNPRENDGMAAIYHYIEEKVNEWYEENVEEIFEKNCKKLEEEEEDEDEDEDDDEEGDE